ncbi:hypothetical protein C1H70_15270 [Halomonas urumqiensis]|uniref:Uncharacterized protein n=2 Tax=Halomonas urumqiensis TaxID=1684789 RepID=A0A2N7UCI2_9GAMM|nr:hypothetical protein C1H70_15270 [Halomonas urumqiensis]PTB03284.1 hypothetical protein C6V82_01910 [Halomonas urumqiensis]
MYDEYALIAESGLFDADRYLAQNPDLAEAGIDPLVHYLRHGGAEGRGPGSAFDTVYYRSQLPAGEVEGWATLLHFLEIGQAQGLKPRRECTDEPWWRQLQGPGEVPDSFLANSEFLAGGWPKQPSRQYRQLSFLYSMQ